MLATFTANLAALLTVERMETTVQSLEELGRQVRTANKGFIIWMRTHVGMPGESIYKSGVFFISFA